MLRLRTILCPVDFSPLSDEAARLATSLARRFKARLVFEHNLLSGPPGYLTVAWMWSETHPQASHAEAEAERQLQRLLAAVPPDVQHEARLTRGSVDTALLFLAGELPADLIVMGSHGWSGPDHRSITELILTGAPCPLLTAAEGHGGDRLRLAVEGDEAPLAVVVPVDFSAGSAGALSLTWALAESLPCFVYLAHPAAAGEDPEMVLHRLRAQVPPHLAARASWRVIPAEVGLGGFAREVGADLVVMGMRPRRRLRWRAACPTPFEILHGSTCPVWFVPAGRASAEANVSHSAAPAVA
jgi:nucleotide-binding universal stress UspA family protein